MILFIYFLTPPEEFWQRFLYPVKLETSKSQLLKFLQFNFLDNKYD
jgi:hypothetical protein